MNMGNLGGKVMYSIGDVVLYGGEGICRISGIEDKKIGGQKMSYYTLKPVDGRNSLFFVPIEGEIADRKLRNIIPAEEIVKIVSGAEIKPWMEDDHERRETYRSAIGNADRSALSSLVKMVEKHREELRSTGHKLHKTDEYFLQETERLLAGEFCALFVMERHDVIPFLLGKFTPEKR